MQPVQTMTPSMSPYMPMNSFQSQNNGVLSSAITSSSPQQNSDIIDFTWELFQVSTILEFKDDSRKILNQSRFPLESLSIIYVLKLKIKTFWILDYKFFGWKSLYRFGRYYDHLKSIEVYCKIKNKIEISNRVWLKINCFFFIWMCF